MKRNQYIKVGDRVSIFQRNGVWYANFIDGGRQVRQSLQTKSKKRAVSDAAQINGRLLAGKTISQQPVPLISDVVQEYLDKLEVDGRSSKTLAKYRYVLELFQQVASTKRADRMDQVDGKLVDEFRKVRKNKSGSEKPKSAKTVYTDTVIVRQLVKFAMRRKYLREDPMPDYRISKPKRKLQPVWTSNQVEQIIQASKGNYQDLFLFLSLTGCRIGEAVWLTWSDIDFVHKNVLIRSKEGWSTKTGNERSIPIANRLLKVLSASKKRTGWVFAKTGSSTQVSDRRALDYLKRRLNSLGLAGHLHTFRHTFVSLASCRGINPITLRFWLGHSDPRMIEWYSHLSNQDSHAAMNRFDLGGEPNDSDEKKDL